MDAETIALHLAPGATNGSALGASGQLPKHVRAGKGPPSTSALPAAAVLGAGSSAEKVNLRNRLRNGELKSRWQGPNAVVFDEGKVLRPPDVGVNSYLRRFILPKQFMSVRYPTMKNETCIQVHVKVPRWAAACVRRKVHGESSGLDGKARGAAAAADMQRTAAAAAAADLPRAAAAAAMPKAAAALNMPGALAAADFSEAAAAVVTPAAVLAAGGASMRGRAAIAGSATPAGAAGPAAASADLLSTEEGNFPSVVFTFTSKVEFRGTTKSAHGAPGTLANAASIVLQTLDRKLDPFVGWRISVLEHEGVQVRQNLIAPLLSHIHVYLDCGMRPSLHAQGQGDMQQVGF